MPDCPGTPPSVGRGNSQGNFHNQGLELKGFKESFEAMMYLAFFFVFFIDER